MSDAIRKPDTPREKEENQDKKTNLVLLVDDDSINRRLLRKVLEDTYDILEAENGLEAMELIQKYHERIMTVVLDLIMPVMNGYQVLEEIKKNRKWKNIPIIILTSEVSEASDLKILDLGVNLVLHKPINMTIFSKQIDNQVNSYREHQSDIREYKLHKSLIGQKENTFLCVYHFATGQVELSEKYRNHMSEDFPEIFQSYPFRLDKFVLGMDYERVRNFFNVKGNENVHQEIEVRFRVDKIHYEWFEISKVVNFDEENRIDNVIFMFFNTEKTVEAKENLLFLAHHDPLTRIPNMQSFFGDVMHILRQNMDTKFVMITFDVFQFNLVNKIFGHKEGDGIIRYIATKLQELVESFSVGAYCRISSDIFCACIPEGEEIDLLMHELQQAMNSYHLKFQLKLCFGMYRIHDVKESVDTMIEHSSYARKKAKEAPVKVFMYYDDELQKSEIFETIVVSEMDTALREEQFEIYLQPKYNIKEEKIIGAEALIRWNHPERGYLSPGYFIPIFEKNGFCQKVDYYVYEKVCQVLRNWLDRGDVVVPVSVNVSRWSLYDSDLVDHILQIVEKYQLPHELIEFEITESAFVMEANLLTLFSERMRKEGFHILIDDFGSGYSSLNSLKDISVDVLKIDIKFLPVNAGEVKAAIVLSSVISMAQKLGLGVITEGVEKAEQVKLLADLGCENVQGYYFYRPMPIKDFKKVLEENH